MPTIQLDGVVKSYGAGPHAVDDLDLTIPSGAFMCLLGPSGCGKTTTLRMIAGLEHTTGGEIRVDDQVLDSISAGRYVPTEKREMGFVFQSYALWPHLTVRRNIDFGLRLRKTPRDERDRRVAEAMESLHITEYADRYPAQLSGGQQQRVALARMLAVGNEVLLLDEPLSNLDASLRLEMRAELKRLHSTLANTIVFVTHDQLEAMTMATHVAVMSQGRLQQVGPPMEVYSRPANLFVAEFVGSPPMNIVRRDAPWAGDLWTFVERAGGPEVAHARAIGIRPESIRLTRAAGTAPGTVEFAARVTTVLPTGSNWIVTFDGPIDNMYATTETPPPADGSMVAAVSRDDLHLFDADGDRITAFDAPQSDALAAVMSRD